MNIIGFLILIVFFAGIIVTTIRRWKNKDFFFGVNPKTAGLSLVFGLVIGLLLAILIGIAISGVNNTEVTYWVNGVRFKGNGNFALYVLYFMFGTLISWLIMLFLSALPVMFLYAISKEHRQELKDIRESGNLPIFERKESIAILIAIFSGGIANWFYLKIWQMGCLILLMYIIGAILNTMGFAIFGAVLFFITLAIWIFGIIIPIKAKTLKLKNCIVKIK